MWLHGSKRHRGHESAKHGGGERDIEPVALTGKVEEGGRYAGERREEQEEHPEADDPAGVRGGKEAPQVDEVEGAVGRGAAEREPNEAGGHEGGRGEEAGAEQLGDTDLKFLGAVVEGWGNEARSSQGSTPAALKNMERAITTMIAANARTRSRLSTRSMKRAP